jgi:hypothetical protein
MLEGYEEYTTLVAELEAFRARHERLRKAAADLLSECGEKEKVTEKWGEVYYYIAHEDFIQALRAALAEEGK